MNLLSLNKRLIAKIVIAPIALLIALVAAFREPTAPDTPSLLGPGESVRVEVDGRKVRITTPKEVKEHFVPDTAKVIVHPDGTSKVEIKKTGFKYELGGGFAVTPNRLKLTVDTRVAFAWRLSAHIGLTADPAAGKAIDVFRPLLFVAYPLETKWTKNTSLWIGRELPGDWCGGLRVRF